MRRLCAWNGCGAWAEGAGVAYGGFIRIVIGGVRRIFLCSAHRREFEGHLDRDKDTDE